MQRRRLLTYVAVACSALALTLFVGWWRVDGPGAPEITGKRPLPLTQMDFQMANQNRETVGPETLLGNLSMVFFGFTYCPDVCPTTLSEISDWLDDLGTDVADMNVVFITVDPERDTAEVMAEYVSYFHPAVQGWRGSHEQTRQAADAFRANYEKVPTEGNGYTMNHTASVFLFDADGKFASTIDYHEPREFAVQKIRRILSKGEEEVS
ncbi:SCO family protein [Sulfitobacter mediterraneus]|jgi:protein SCO1/2|uniref:SCO family protein n=1 Tax=Sulfitobacter mediterraneus TaxID=83219 RepID=UPI00193AC580|nr:SCO family protein [Sulfitobacter mediterraneus]MBM1558488.1 SCO family protein [Sulfitobacter mediterraneus]MBM1569819.1 SCO family protein [Sulfitobacter mediterraneus]MBM1573777.1 SCO family protein [Sulfitobacter mediterraneus]MBM1577606.1 SCO family protein [Sulfitobacter mediterraneus]MBM1581476.1 SCO family protein [Sulfitobacter mediterraneus]